MNKGIWKMNKVIWKKVSVDPESACSRFARRLALGCRRRR